MPEGNGDQAGGDRIAHKFECPVCGKDQVTAMPPHFLGEPVEPAETRRIAVVPIICNNCKAITLVLSPEQPRGQPSQPS